MRPVLQVSKQNVKFSLSYHIPALLNTKCAEIELKLTNLLPVSTFRWIDKRRFFCCLPDCLFLSLSSSTSPSFSHPLSFPLNNSLCPAPSWFHLHAGNAFYSALCVNVMHISDANDIQQRRGKGRTEREGEREREWERIRMRRSRGEELMERLEDWKCQLQRQRPRYLTRKLLTMLTILLPLFSLLCVCVHVCACVCVRVHVSTSLFALQRQLLSIINFR